MLYYSFVVGLATSGSAEIDPLLSTKKKVREESMRVLLAVGFLSGLLIFGAAGGWWFASTWLSPELSVRVEPELIELVDRPVENETAVAQFVLVNASDNPLLINEARGNCGCMKVETRGGELKSPTTIPPRSQLPWKAQIDTRGKAGVYERGVLFFCEQNGRACSAYARIKLEVQPSWYIFPPVVQLDNVEPNSEVDVLVGLYAGANLPFESLAAPSFDPPEDVQAEWIDDVAGTTLPATADIHGAPGTLRRSMKIRLKSGARGESRKVRVEVAHPTTKTSPVSVNLVCRTSPEEFQLIPSSLVLPSSADDAPIRRVVRCRKNGDPSGPLSIMNCPANVTATLREVDTNNWDVEIEARRSEVREPARVDFCVGVDKRVACSLWVKPLGSNEP